MKKRLILIGVTIWMILFAPSVWAINCKELDTDQKIRAFIRKTKASNPLNRENVSFRMEMVTREKGGKGSEQLHILRVKDKKRTVFLKGKNAPMCFVTVGKRDYKCNECTLLSNSQCRSYKSSEKSTTIRGTNIDTADFDLLESKDFQSVCKEIPKKPAYLKIISTKVSGTSGYDKIIGYYDKNKEVPILNHYQAQSALRKVYRFFPMCYIKLKDEWVATVTRVRTAQGSEKRYSFETMVKVTENKQKKYQIYLEPKQDPLLKKANLRLIFNTE